MQEENNTHTINDYELISLAREHNEDATNLIYKKYQPITLKLYKKHEKILKKYGLESEDITQECNIIIATAIETFNERKETSFYTFLIKCFQNRFISILRTQQKEGYKILNEAVSLDEESKEETKENMYDFIKTSQNNPIEIMIEEEKYSKLYNKILKTLSNLEECILILKVQNYNYKEIADILDKDEKSIDNAMQRIRLKVKKIMALK